MYQGQQITLNINMKKLLAIKNIQTVQYSCPWIGLHHLNSSHTLSSFLFFSLSFTHTHTHTAHFSYNKNHICPCEEFWTKQASKIHSLLQNVSILTTMLKKKKTIGYKDWIKKRARCLKKKKNQHRCGLHSLNEPQCETSVKWHCWIQNTFVDSIKLASLTNSKVFK